MKKILSIICLFLVISVGYGQPGTKLPTINKSDANKDTRKLPAIQQPAKPKSTNPNNPARNNGEKPRNTYNYANDEVSLNDLIKEYVHDLMSTNSVNLNCTFYGGTRYAVGLKTQSGGMAVLSALPDLFDNKYEYASDCYTLIREISAKNSEGRTWEVEKNEYAKEFAPGFFYIPGHDPLTSGNDFVTPASERISGYMVWIVKGKDGVSDYVVVNEELNFNGTSSSTVRQPSVNAVAGVFFDDSPNVNLCAVARLVDAKWKVVRVTTSSEQIEADMKKASIPQTSNQEAEPSRSASPREDMSRSGQPQMESSKGKNSKSDSSRPGKDKSDKQKPGKKKDARHEGAGDGAGRGSEVDAPNERGSDAGVTNERELDIDSPRDSGRGGGDETEGRR